MLIISIILVSLGGCILFTAGILLHFFPKPPRPKHDHYDFALVLGCPCQEDGSLTLMQKRRMDHALHLYEQKTYSLLIVSGGSVKNAHNEATTMLAYAQAHADIASEAETKATNTYENFVRSRPLWQRHHCRSAIIITSPFHARRANYFARRYFSDYGISTYPQRDRLRNWPIEWYCMCKCLWTEYKIRKGRLTP